MAATDKDEFNAVVDRFLCPTITERPMVFEVFTDTISETSALKTLEDLMTDNSVMLKNKAKDAVKSVMGQKGINAIKSIIKNK